MRYPVILFVGAAGSGKDTAAAIVARGLDGVVLSLADEIKRFASNFGFTEEQLWGPSENRNAADERFRGSQYLDQVRSKVNTSEQEWAQGLPFENKINPTLSLQFFVNDLLDPDNVKRGLSPRKVLQILGTEWGRMNKRDIWVEHALSNVAKILGGGHDYSRYLGVTESTNNHNVVVIPDGRFRSEAMAVKRQGGLVIRLVDPSGVKKDIGGVQGHVSETEQAQIPGWHFDYTVVNDKSQGIAALEASLAVIIGDIVAVEPLGGRSRGHVFDVVKHGK